jgi:hypothetical protein
VGSAKASLNLNCQERVSQSVPSLKGKLEKKVSIIFFVSIIRVCLFSSRNSEGKELSKYRKRCGFWMAKTKDNVATQMAT